MLEGRLFFAVTPAEPRANTLGAVFDKTERQDLLARLTHLDATTRADLQSRLNTSLGKFDTGLLNYMRARTGPKFFFDPNDTDELGDFITNNNIDTSEVITHADAITDHKFPEQGNAGTYDIQLPASINWVAPGGSTNPEFLHNLNRFEYQKDLVWAAAITGDAKYATEFEYQLASWAQQFTTAKVPSAWSATDKEAWELDSALRGESWSWAYNGFLENANFTGAENSLFLYKIAQTADYLYGQAAATTAFGSNKTIVTGKALLFLGTLFPEFDESNLWKDQAHTVLFKCMDTQIYADGSHVEQSPGYIFNVSNDLLDARMIDRVNGVAWPKEQKLRLANMVDSYWQFLSPNGKRPAIGDSYRNQSLKLFNKPDIILETTRWPMVKPGVGDVFIGGIAAVTPFLSAPNNPDTLGARGKTYAMTDSGNYVLRSGDDKLARQINFDAGPKGGSHGHLDLLSFELSGYGRPLISDPGAYKYIPSDASRKYVISTAAHNTINADGANIAAIEGATNPDINVSQWKAGADFAQITATHKGYKALAGAPLITRSMWYDLDGTIIIVDWAQGSVAHNYQQSFNLQTEGDANNNFSFDFANLTARTQYPSGGNVQIKGVTTAGESADAQLSFVTNTASGDYKDDAYRFTLNQSGKFVVMVTLITAYDGTTPPNTTASLVSAPTENGTVKVLLTKNGKAQQVDFSRPATLSALDSKATNRGTFNDIAYDATNRIHMVYADRDTSALMYAVRDAAGAWSAPVIVDRQANSDALGAYQYISLAIDANGSPAVAYFDGWNGDLKYAARSATGTWTAVTVDSKGSTGLYPSLAFSRTGVATISYYDRTNKDLKLAQAAKGAFNISSIDTGGDVGRFSSLALDPNRPTVTAWAVGYEDTTNGDYRYSIQNQTGSGFTSYLVDNLAIGGGYTSLTFYATGPKTNRKYNPAMSYYDANNTDLRFAKSTDAGQTWAAETVATTKVQGLYTSVFFDSLGKANIFFFDRTNNEARRAVFNGTTWDLFDLRAGGREMHTSLDSAGHIAYSSLNEANGQLNVYVI